MEDGYGNEQSDVVSAVWVWRSHRSHICRIQMDEERRKKRNIK